MGNVFRNHIFIYYRNNHKCNIGKIVLYFLCVFEFLTQSKENNDKKQQTTKAFKQKFFKKKHARM